MPPTRPLSTPCRYGYGCTRPDCFYTHPKGMGKDRNRPKDDKQLCSFGRSCFRRVCLNDHPQGRLVDQLRANMDYCAAWMLVRPNELVRVSAAFQQAFPAPSDGKDRCDFVAAVPIRVAYQDWKTYRGVSATGTPDGVPSSPQKIQLYPRTRKGERLLQEAENRVGMRWSPTPTLPWRMLERMATHDVHWEENVEMFVLCAGYEATPPGSGICIELSVTGMVRAEDGGDGQKAGARVAREVLGLPGANGQKWFVFHVSRPDESDDEAHSITVRTIVETSKMSAGPRRPEASGGAPQPTQPVATPPNRSGTPPAATPADPALQQHNLQQRQQQQKRNQQQQQQLKKQQRRQLQQQQLLQQQQRQQQQREHLQQQKQQQQQQQQLGQPSTAPASSASSSSSAYAFSNSTAPDQPGIVSFGSFTADESAAAATTGPPPPQPSPPPPPPPQPQQPENPGVDELTELLASLNMTKYRPKFDDQNVDFKALKTMTVEDQLSGIGIPLGPRIKLMKELGIERRPSS